MFKELRLKVGGLVDTDMFHAIRAPLLLPVSSAHGHRDPRRAVRSDLRKPHAVPVTVRLMKARRVVQLRAFRRIFVGNDTAKE